jgi:hypothetical protein
MEGIQAGKAEIRDLVMLIVIRPKILHQLAELGILFSSSSGPGHAGFS